MSTSKNQKAIPRQKSNSNRHESHCKICAHPQREEIEEKFTDWMSSAKIAAEFKLGDRSSIYRHANAMNLYSKRNRNLRAPLSLIVERADEAVITAAAVMQAISMLARMNKRGELVDLDDQVGTQELFDEMSPDELEAYGKDGTLPDRFTLSKGAKGPQGSGGDENE
jgi:hypothetical protein